MRERPLAAGELARELSLAPPAMSRHLRVLRQTGLVEEERSELDSRVRVYRLRREPFGELRSWLEQVESFWTDELMGFKRHVEQRARKKGR